MALNIRKQHVIDELDSTLTRLNELRNEVQAQRDRVSNDYDDDYKPNWFTGLQDLNDAVREAQRVMRKVLY